MSAVYQVTKLRNGVLYEDSVEKVSLHIPHNSAEVNFCYFNEPEAVDFDNMMTQAMAAPLNTLPLRDLAKNKHSVSIIVSDATRAVQTSRVLPYIIKELEEAGICLDDIRIIVAIGVHRNATEREMMGIAGIYHGKVLVENHTPFTGDNLIVLGKTSYGTTVEVNRRVYESDLKISIGKIEPHEFAGFSGGRKSVLPGISSESCITHNHRPEMLLNSNAVAGVLEGNPVHLDMLETAKMLGVDFTVNLVQNAHGDPIGIFVGDLEESHRQGVEFVKKHFSVYLGGDSDIYIVTPGYPLNIDLYQSVKALIALTPVVKQNDVIILYSSCNEGVNSEDMLKPFKVSPRLDSVLQYITDNYKIQMDHSLLLCKLYQKGVKVVAFVPGVEDSVLSLLHMIPAKSLEDACNIAFKLKAHNVNDIMNLAIIPTPQRSIIKIG